MKENKKEETKEMEKEKVENGMGRMNGRKGR